MRLYERLFLRGWQSQENPLCGGRILAEACVAGTRQPCEALAE